MAFAFVAGNLKMTLCLNFILYDFVNTAAVLQCVGLHLEALLLSLCALLNEDQVLSEGSV